RASPSGGGTWASSARASASDMVGTRWPAGATGKSRAKVGRVGGRHYVVREYLLEVSACRLRRLTTIPRKGRTRNPESGGHLRTPRRASQGKAASGGPGGHPAEGIGARSHPRRAPW